MSYKIEYALSPYLIVEAVDKSTILKTEETATIFRVIAGENEDKKDLTGLLIIVAPASVEKTMMGSKEVHYVRRNEAIAVITE